jgi:hypothetical protein
VTARTRAALLTFAIGFLVEGATEVYQFLAGGYLARGWVGFYYVGLATTIIGFYLMYLGRHEWTETHRKRVRAGHRLAWAAVAIFGLATVAIAILGDLYGGPDSSGPPAALGWLVGGAVAVAFGSFFLGLVVVVEHLVGRYVRVATWVAFGWSLGVAVLTGFVVGREFPSLLRQFFTNPLLLVGSFAPLAFVIAPLFVTYFLFSAAYLDAFHTLERARRPHPVSVPADPGQARFVPEAPTGGRD